MKNVIYSKPMFYFLNSVFFLVNIAIQVSKFIIGLIKWPFAALRKFYNFMIQVNIFLRIQKTLIKVFELNFKNIPCENNINSEDAQSLLESFNYFENKKNKPDISGEVNEDSFSFDYRYRGIELNISKLFRKKIYIIKLKLNDNMLINCRKLFHFKIRRFERLFL